MGLGSWKATSAVLGYYALSMVLYKVLPANDTPGTVLQTGGTLKYKLNSTSTSFIVLHVRIAAS